VRGDADSIERALRNLVENALRYASHTVDVAIERDGDDVVVVVSDDGPGFPQAWLDQGVGRFAPGASPESHGGAGLGLAIVDAIVGSHGGTVQVGTAPAGGGEVRLRLPRAQPAEVPART
jgi:signal transduction histidine kinase